MPRLKAPRVRALSAVLFVIALSALVGGIFGAGTSAVSGFGNWYDASVRDEMNKKLAALSSAPQTYP